MQWLIRAWQALVAWWTGRGPGITVQVIHDDLFPSHIPANCLVALFDDGPYAAAMRCPCGCGETIELMLMEGIRPRWDFTVDRKKRPTLRPSVWRETGCRSHFWLRAGQVIWCE